MPAIESDKPIALRRHMRGAEVCLLHILLNAHLPTPDDQLPIFWEPGGYDFGPRTEAKVKRFQKINKIDFGTDKYMDGVVGKHTWKFLAENLCKIDATLSGHPKAKKKPETRPESAPTQVSDKEPIPEIPRSSYEGPYKFSRIDFQFGPNWVSPAVGNYQSWQFLLSGTFLRKADGFHVEHGVGVLSQINKQIGKGWDDSKVDLGLAWSVKWANMPTPAWPWFKKWFNRVSWSIGTQTTVMKTLDNTPATTIGLPLPGLEVDVRLLKHRIGKTEIEWDLMASGGPFLNVEIPRNLRSNNYEVRLSLGATGFLGLTGQFTLFGN